MLFVRFHFRCFSVAHSFVFHLPGVFHLYFMDAIIGIGVSDEAFGLHQKFRALDA